MLILTRRSGESIYIGDNVVVTVLGVVGNQVRFGVEAPRSITIDRAEVHERKKRQAHARLAGDAVGNLTAERMRELVDRGRAAQGAVDELIKEVDGNK